MWLLNTFTGQLEEFTSYEDGLKYGILSHRWEGREVTFRDLKSSYEEDATPTWSHKLTPALSQGWKKIQNFCQLAREQHELKYVWVDTCCIDKSSSAELSEAINSMYRWYNRAQKCFVYLHDVKHSSSECDKPNIKESKWFDRGWTLQELLAPGRHGTVLFFDREWRAIGSRDELRKQITKRTGISSYHLLYPRHASIAQRMSWAASRITTRPEDIAYCLLGLFDVNMPLLYGEGGMKAFRRLQEEILRTSDDESLYAWCADKEGWPDSRGILADGQFCGMLANNVKYFAAAGNIVGISGFRKPSTMTPKGLSMQIQAAKIHTKYEAFNLQWPLPPSIRILKLFCAHESPETNSVSLRPLAIILRSKAWRDIENSIPRSNKRPSALIDNDSSNSPMSALPAVCYRYRAWLEEFPPEKHLTASVKKVYIPQGLGFGVRRSRYDPRDYETESSEDEHEKPGKV